MTKEISLHIAAVASLRKRIKDGWLFLHPPNGELRDSPRAVAKLKAMGMLNGAPDLIVFSPEGKAHFLEFKSESGTLSAAQKDFMLWSSEADLPYSVARSVDEALKQFEIWEAIPR
jgi:hypothetical protein